MSSNPSISISARYNYIRFVLSNSFLISLIVVTSCSAPHSYITSEELTIEKENYQENFLEIHHKIQKSYSHLTSKNISVNRLEKEYLKRILNTTTLNEYILVLSQYFGELKNSHTGLYLKPFIVKAKAKKIGKKIYLDKVVDSGFIKIGISRFDQIIAVNSVPVLQWLQEEANYISSSTSQDKEERTVRNIFKSNIRVERQYTFKTRSGLKVVKTSLKPYEPPPHSRAETVSSRVLKDSIGYIKLHSMTGDVKSAFENIYVTMDKLPTLIIDLRTNGGGDSSYSEYIARYLLKNTIRACVSGKKLRPRNNSYQRKLYVLISPYTISAAESFLLDLKDNYNTVFVGSTSAGDTGNRAKIFKTSYGVSFKIPTRKPGQITSNGFPMEGIGVTPHYEVKLSEEDYLNGVDTVLEFTINNIVNSN